MKCYDAPYPDVDDVTMCTVTNYSEESGFEVHLDEYDINGFLMLAELHAKKIHGPISGFLKINTQLPLIVNDPGNGKEPVYLSKKGVTETQIEECKQRYALNTKLFNLAKRLPGTLWDGELEATFRKMNDPNNNIESHPWTLLQNREWDILSEDLSAHHIDALKGLHSKLFGVKPQTVRAKFSVFSFGIHGNDTVRDRLLEIATDHEWSNEQLYEDTERYNVSIQPIALPSFQLKVTAYERDRCYSVIDGIRAKITSFGFDHVSGWELDPIPRNEN